MDTVAVYTALKLRRNCFLYASPESCPCMAASLPGSPCTRSAGTDVPATPPPAWPSRMGNWEQRRELTLEIPTVAGAKLRPAPKWVSQRPEGDCNLESTSPLMLHQVAGRGPGPPQSRNRSPRPKGKRQVAHPSHMHKHTPLTSCCHLGSRLGTRVHSKSTGTAKSSGHSAFPV